MTTGYEDYDYPLEVGDELCHTLLEDLRKKLWLIFYAYRATTLNAKKPTGTYSASDGQYWASGPFHEGTIYADEGTVPGTLNGDDRRAPGYIDCWHEGKWGNSIGGAGASDYDIKGATIDHTASSGHEIWIENNTINTYTDGEETVEGNLLVGCPLELTGGPSEATGFWRIKSARTHDEGGTEYRLVTLEKFHSDGDLVLSSDYGHPGTSYTGGSGDVECDFGGDWYMLCPKTGGSVAFISDQDMIYQGTDNKRCDGELRPPDGGYYSADWNTRWISTVNPYLYHHYDFNAHRWVAPLSEWDEGGSPEDWFSVLESWRMLPLNSDPKERVPPFYYDNTGRIAWQIAGNKVEVEKEYFTDWDRMLAKQGSQINMETFPTDNVIATDETYRTRTWRTLDSGAGSFFQGTIPPMSDDPAWHKQRPFWKEWKMNTRCYWPWIEMAADYGGYVAEINTEYKINWMEVNRKATDVTVPGDPAGTTYEDKWWGTTWDLEGYRPDWNSGQPRFDYLYSKLWGKNGAAIEKILSDLNRYDWWFDPTAKYVPLDIMQEYGEIYYGQQNSHDPTPATSDPENAAWEHPPPAGTWRMIPDETLGYKDFTNMRSKESGTPAGSEIVDVYTDMMHNELEVALETGEWKHFCSLYAKQAPAAGEFDMSTINAASRYVNEGDETNSYTDTDESNDTRHEMADIGDGIDYYYECDTGDADNYGVKMAVEGYYQSNGGSGTCKIQAYDWANTVWRNIMDLPHNTSDQTYTIYLYPWAVGTGGNDGKIRIKFFQESQETGSVIKIDFLEIITIEKELVERHGWTADRDGEIFHEKVFKTLDLMLKVMGELKYKDLTPYIGASIDNIVDYMSDDITFGQSDTDPQVLGDWWNANCADAIDPDLSTWADAGAVAPFLQTVTLGQITPPDWEFVGSPDYYQTGAFKFTDFDKIFGMKKIWMSLKIDDMPGPVALARRVAAKFTLFDGSTVTQRGQGEGFIYAWFKIFDVISSSKTIDYARITWENAFEDLIYDNYMGGNKWAILIDCDVSINTIGALSVIGEIDWTDIPDECWERDDTFKNCPNVNDPTEDENPPVYEPIKFEMKPTIYDANRPHQDTAGDCYSWPSYVAEWHIKMEVILMEDLEGNGVEYEFVGSGGSGTTKGVDFGRTYHVDKDHDMILDMGVGTDAGDADDLEEALKNGSFVWTFINRAIDDASAAGAGQTDNVTDDSTAEATHANEGRIVPPYALWKTVPTIDGSDVDMEIRDCSGPEDDRPCEYYFESTDSTWTRGWSTTKTATHTGGSGAGKDYRCYGRTVTDNIITLQSSELAAV